MGGVFIKKLKPFIKYLSLVLVDFVFLAALLFSIYALKDVMYSWLFSYADLIMLYGVPLCLLLRAVLSRIFLKNAWLPNLILLFEIWPGRPLLSGEFDFGGIIPAAIISLASLMISLLTGAIMRLISLKKNHKTAQD